MNAEGGNLLNAVWQPLGNIYPASQAQHFISPNPIKTVSPQVLGLNPGEEARASNILYQKLVKVFRVM